jgi:hypothetical protein
MDAMTDGYHWGPADEIRELQAWHDASLAALDRARLALQAAGDVEGLAIVDREFSVSGHPRSQAQVLAEALHGECAKASAGTNHGPEAHLAAADRIVVRIGQVLPSSWSGGDQDVRIGHLATALRSFLGSDPDAAPTEDEQGGCVYCGASPARKPLDTPAFTDHSADCPWVIGHMALRELGPSTWYDQHRTAAHERFLAICRELEAAHPRSDWYMALTKALDDIKRAGAAASGDERYDALITGQVFGELLESAAGLANRHRLGVDNLLAALRDGMPPLPCGCSEDDHGISLAEIAEVHGKQASWRIQALLLADRDGTTPPVI